MRPAQHRQRLSRLEQAVAPRAPDPEKPFGGVSLRQLCGLEPITPAQLEACSVWMDAHGFDDAEDLADDDA